MNICIKQIKAAAAFLLTLVLFLSLSACSHDDKTQTDGSSEASADAAVVYITKTGEKYHAYGCRCLSQSCIEITLDKAKDKGYTPCSLCNP